MHWLLLLSVLIGAIRAAEVVEFDKFNIGMKYVNAEENALFEIEDESVCDLSQELSCIEAVEDDEGSCDGESIKMIFTFNSIDLDGSFTETGDRVGFDNANEFTLSDLSDDDGETESFLYYNNFVGQFCDDSSEYEEIEEFEDGESVEYPEFAVKALIMENRDYDSDRFSVDSDFNSSASSLSNSEKLIMFMISSILTNQAEKESVKSAN